MTPKELQSLHVGSLLKEELKTGCFIYVITHINKQMPSGWLRGKQIDLTMYTIQSIFQDVHSTFERPYTQINSTYLCSDEWQLYDN